MRILIFFFSLIFTSQLWAEVQWLANEQGYKLKAATLFKMRKELSAEQKNQLKALRNVEFTDLASFKAALEKSIGDDQALSATLIEKAQQPAISYGVEARKPLLSLIISDQEHSQDDNEFTKRSWLTLPEPAKTTALNTQFGGKCLKVSANKQVLFELCNAMRSGEQTSAFIKTSAQSILGLGQAYNKPGDTNTNRLGEVRVGKNAMLPFNKGFNGDTLFPIAYFDFPKNENKQPFAIILDNRYPQSWDLSSSPYKLNIEGGDFKLHVLTGKNLAEIRRDYMRLTGTPLIPPKSAFGLWLSEYGFDNWAELDDKIASLKKNNFPLSGVVMDLQWFGGISEDEHSKMGSLTWDLVNFPKPVEKIAAYKKQNIDMIVIEESYISKGLEEYKTLDKKGYLAHDNEGNSLDATEDPAWWGHGGMFDWTNKEARDFWHDYRRQDLINAGVIGHWTDLGEPEMHNPHFKYSDGLNHEMIHNSYNNEWLQSIYDGYQRNNPEKRPFMMSRSGGMGIQALGAIVWSGDTASDYASLASQMPQQSHMMWSGLDYYSSDVGGFHRAALQNIGEQQDKEQAMNELFTQWFAYSSLFEVPVRAHTENLCNCKETAPDRIGDIDSNLANINLRYQLLPYYYSLAYRAAFNAEPIFPSLEYYYDNDQQAKNLGQVKMIGPFLVGSAIAKAGQQSASTYLPKGTWFDFRNGNKIDSAGQWLEQDVYVNKLLTLPLFVQQGALVPMHIDNKNSLKVFGFGEQTFTWYDDDGMSTAYQQGDYQKIQLQSKNQVINFTRDSGEKLTIDQLIWVLPTQDKVKSITSEMGELDFIQQGNTVIVTLPKIAKSLSVSLKL